MTKTNPDHNCGDTLLRCVDCASAVCPKCMIACPVGNRCASCAGRQPQGAVSARNISSREQTLRLLGCALLLGIGISWLDWYMGNFLQGVFWLVFLIAGAQAGQSCRKDTKELLPLFLIGTFTASMFASVIVFAIAEHFGNIAVACVPAAFNTVAIAIGFLVGRFIGFGCR